MTSATGRDFAKQICNRIIRAYGVFGDVLSRLESVALLAMRLLVARVFILSGLTKWDGLHIRQDAFDLFQYEYFERYALPEPMLVVFTVMAALGEIVLPVLLAFGVLGRAAAVGLLGMALVIQLFVYPEEWWAIHAWWIAVLFLLAARGPGALSIDWLMGIDRRRE